MQININTLAELITFFSQKQEEGSSDIESNSPAHFHIYEMGRSIRKISAQEFADFEDTLIPWSYPFLKQAWFALVFTEPKQPNEFTVWFLKFPLDEQAKLVQVARNDYLKQFIDSIYIDKTENISQESPYGFTPNEEKRANFNAIVTKQLTGTASSFYPACLDYVHAKTELDQWPELGYQGIADVCARLDEKHHGKSNLQALYEIIPQLPDEPFRAFSSCLENHSLNSKLSQQIYKRAITLNNNDNDMACLRALSQASSDSTALSQLLTKILPLNIDSFEEIQTEYPIELMAILSGRCWEQLKQEKVMQAFLEALARVPEGQESFNVIVSDLLFIPGMRDCVLQQIRNPNRSTKLSHAIGHFFQTMK